jgi:hypothetical protein
MAQAKVINPNRDLAAAIKAIKKVEPDLIKQMQKDMRRAAAPTIKTIKDYALWLDPDLTPFNNSGDSNIEKGELIKGRGGKTQWRKEAILRGIRVKFGGGTRKSRMGRKQYAIMSIYQANPAGAIYDNAGSGPSDSAFVQNLDNQDQPHKDGERKGKKGASRYMWPGAESSLPMLRDKATAIMNSVILEFNNRKVAS